MNKKSDFEAARKGRKRKGRKEFITKMKKRKKEVSAGNITEVQRLEIA